MKTVRTIAVIVALSLMLAAGLAYTDTARLGDSSWNYNPVKKLFKTAAYTLTTADTGAQAEFTATSANIVVTLPSVASALASGGGVQYKIIKKDATTYKIVLTPANGDTVGGESTRYIVGDESYIVLHAGPGKDWTIDYESPYIVEDHEAGTYTTGIGSGGLYSATSGSGTVTLTGSDCGNVITMGTGTTTYALPATIAKCEFTFINGVGGTTAPLIINPVDADQIFGGCTLAASVVTIAGSAGDSITNTGTTTVKGDYVKLTGSGTAATGWWINGCQGIWADTN
ncbi:MAG: hypothetical protein ABIH23_20290 [bacterium]